MTRLMLAASAAILISAAGAVPSLAQSSASGTTMPTITCRDISGMDPQTARNVVFYLSGLKAAGASSTAMNSTDTTSGASGSTTTDTSDTTGSTTAAGSSSASGDSSNSASVAMAQLPGFSGINADQIISGCQSTPDKQLSEVLGSGAASAQ